MSTDYTGIGSTDQTSNSADGALARYQYLLRTASPDSIEQAHEQAFAAMSAEERQQVLAALAKSGETPADASAASLARSATRLEIQQPGAMQQLLGSQGGLGKTVLASLAAGVVGSAVWGTLTGNDGVGGRPGILSRLFGMGGGLFGNRGYGQGGLGGGMFGGQQGGGMFGGQQRGMFGGPGGQGGPGGHGGPGGFGGGPGGGPGGFGGGPGGGGPF